MITVKINVDLAKAFKAEEDRIKAETMKTLVSALKAATPVDTGEARDGWKIEGDKIVNRVEHISHLNGGSSQQAPSHFVEATVLAHKGIVPNGTIVRSK